MNEDDLIIKNIIDLVCWRQISWQSEIMLFKIIICVASLVDGEILYVESSAHA